MAREHKGKLTLDSLLIMPVQRIPRYELLIQVSIIAECFIRDTSLLRLDDVYVKTKTFSLWVDLKHV